MRNSRNWTISLPTGLGPFDPFANLRCGDLDGAKDNMRVLPGSVYGRDIAVSGRRYEMARVTDESQAGTLNLSCTEEAAGGLDTMRVIGCPFPIQRRVCLPDTPAYYEHYAAVNLGERELQRPTATGVDKEDNTPTVSFPGVFSRRFPLTDSHPSGYDFTDGEVSSTELFMNAVYCYNPLCGDCGLPCDHLYALVRVTIDEENGLVIYKSDDGGKNWSSLAVAPFHPLEDQSEGFIFCYQGSRLFATSGSPNLYYSNSPDDGEWYEVAQLNSLFSGTVVTHISKMVSDGYTIFAIVGDANQTGIIRSVDGGITWEFVVPIDSLTTVQLYDIAIAGDVVMVYGQSGGQGQISISYSRGDFQTWTQYTNAAWPDVGAIAAANPNPFDPTRAWFYVLGEDGGSDIQVWKGSSDSPDLVELIHEVDYPASNWHLHQIFLDGDGYIGWFHACQRDGTSITLRTSTGGNNFVNVSLNTTSGAVANARSGLAVCPHDPDVGFVGYTS